MLFPIVSKTVIELARLVGRTNPMRRDELMNLSIDIANPPSLLSSKYATGLCSHRLLWVNPQENAKQRDMQ